MKKVFFTINILLTSVLPLFSQQKSDSLKQIQLDEVVVSTTRVQKDAPTAYSNMSESQIKKNNAGKNIPFVLQTLPSVVAYSEDGSGLGNTSLRIRGTDATRINVTLNGMPLNNPESQDVFWVNLPNLSNSLHSMQVQRGVGTSTNGSAAFGGSISLQTTGAKAVPYGEASTAIGSYNSFVSSIGAGTGVLKNGLSIDGSYSHTSGDGYIRNGKVDHKNAYVTAAHFSEKQLIRLVYMNGTQHTGITWEGITPEMMAIDRRYNLSGEYKDDAGQKHYYDNETDNYYSNIAQAIYTRYLSSTLTFNANFSYNNGYGYYENYKKKRDFDEEYGLKPQIIDGITYNTSDVIRQKLMSNNLYAGMANISYRKDKLSLSGGAMYSYFEGSHYGKLKWVKYNENIPANYQWYRSESTKRDMNLFVKGEYALLPNLNLFGELQNRYVDYRMDGIDDDRNDMTKNFYYNFVNPKAGFSYNVDANNNIYASFGTSNREPQRSDLKEYAKSKKMAKAERLFDYEVGYRFSSELFSFESNVYYMDYKDQLVSTGKLNDVGYRLQENVPNSYRMGVELSAAYTPLKWLRIDANTTLSQNKIKDYKAYYTLDWSETEQTSEFYKSTNISYSPNITGSGILTITPMKDLDISFINKYVGKMYLDNTASEEKQLDAYFVTNMVAGYTFRTTKMGEIALQFYVNNIFNKRYVGGGYIYGEYRFSDTDPMVEKRLFPQATRNIMARMSVKF